MGMIGNIVRVSQNELNTFLENSELFENKIYSEENYDAEWNLDLDKSWEGIQYLLTGKGMAELEEPNILTRAFFSFQILDEEQDLGYGPAQYLTSEQVIETNSELQKLDIDKLKNKVSGTDMIEKGIYPEIWTESEAMEFLFDNFKDFLDFYKKASENNEAILSFIN
ncbi:YfbM family protein [Aquimarina algiphila]|uniref:YfbM family protein n=1 Tax=Aquimarina algiphila TaxID=2047982 RepID=UPI002493C2F7|nr:YfbM family protein [Aquimarina algiphila]